MPNLVGTGLNQVPTNGMLGGLAYQDPEHASIKDLDLKNLSQINSEIADTAVDVFVYDTRKDSDGGAWRKRTQNTSWYNETLGTATRGTRREFPAVAVIVAEYEKITIYDGDDPDLPMWMIFNYGTNNGSLSGMAMLYSNGKAVSALNGIISSVGSDGWHDGLTEINFLADFSRFRNNSNVADWSGGIGTRNTSGGYGSFYNTSSMYIANVHVNDVAMTVLPNAPIDDATGLPVPTIAIATVGGVSVIKDNGSVVDISESVGSAYVGKISFRKDNKLGFFTSGTANADGYPQPYYIDIPSSDLSVNYFYNITQGNVEKYGGTAWESNSADRLLLYNEGTTPQNSDLVDIVDTSNLTYAATNQGLNAIIRPDVFGTPNAGRANMLSGAVAYIQNNYNTGYMPGDIKGAFLSDTDTTNVVGGNLVTNGTFASDSDWEKSGGWIISGGSASMPSTSSYLPLYQYNLGMVAGKKYVATVTVSALSGSIKFGTANSTGGNIQNTELLINGTGVFSYTFIAESDQDGIGAARNTQPSSATIDNIKVALAEEDRSGRANPLMVFGTVTKTPVATGAELVAYSGFSLTNYLRQPYNSDLDLGTGDFCIAVWAKRSNESTQVILEKGNGTSNRLYLYVSSSNDIRFSCGNQGTSIYGNISDTTGWYQIVMVRRSGTVHGYVNGNATSVTSNAQTVTGSTDDELFIGKTVSSQYPWSGSIALVRISGSAPSAEQIKKMYEDEKCLFHENAKATLYGSSDAVTALAYDDTTELLHVGTSAGRSEFQGLSRINNTTTAVTTAISASNGLVTEQ